VVSADDRSDSDLYCFLLASLQRSMLTDLQQSARLQSQGLQAVKLSLLFSRLPQTCTDPRYPCSFRDN
jgi:hypothetical protein